MFLRSIQVSTMKLEVIQYLPHLLKFLLDLLTLESNTDLILAGTKLLATVSTACWPRMSVDFLVLLCCIHQPVSCKTHCGVQVFSQRQVTHRHCTPFREMAIIDPTRREAETET